MGPLRGGGARLRVARLPAVRLRRPRAPQGHRIRAVHWPSSRRRRPKGGAVAVAFGDVMYHAGAEADYFNELQPVPPESRALRDRPSLRRLHQPQRAAGAPRVGRVAVPLHHADVCKARPRGRRPPSRATESCAFAFYRSSRSPRWPPRAAATPRRRGSTETCGKALQVALLQALSPAALPAPPRVHAIASRTTLAPRRVERCCFDVVVYAVRCSIRTATAKSGSPGEGQGTPARSRAPVVTCPTRDSSTPVLPASRSGSGRDGAPERRRRSSTWARTSS